MWAIVSVNKKDLEAYKAKLEALKKEVPEIMDRLAVSEGVYAVRQARLICKNDSPDIINTGDYRRNFQADKQALRNGKSYRVRFYNNLDYAKPLEYGFRSHFVPGHWEGHVFVYQPKDEEGGMYVGSPGGFVPGHFTLRRAAKRTKDTQNARLSRKIGDVIRRRMKG